MSDYIDKMPMPVAAREMTLAEKAEVLASAAGQLAQATERWVHQAQEAEGAKNEMNAARARYEEASIQFASSQTERADMRNSPVLAEARRY